MSSMASRPHLGWQTTRVNNDVQMTWNHRVDPDTRALVSSAWRTTAPARAIRRRSKNPPRRPAASDCRPATKPSTRGRPAHRRAARRPCPRAGAGGRRGRCPGPAPPAPSTPAQLPRAGTRPPWPARSHSAPVGSRGRSPRSEPQGGRRPGGSRCLSPRRRRDRRRNPTARGTMDHGAVWALDSAQVMALGPPLFSLLAFLGTALGPGQLALRPLGVRVRGRGLGGVPRMLAHLGLQRGHLGAQLRDHRPELVDSASPPSGSMGGEIHDSHTTVRSSGPT